MSLDIDEDVMQESWYVETLVRTMVLAGPILWTSFPNDPDFQIKEDEDVA